MNNSLDFSGKVALVTGAAAGMGLAGLSQLEGITERGGA